LGHVRQLSLYKQLSAIWKILYDELFSAYRVEYAGVVCDIDNTEGRTCILRSPIIPDTFSWSCMLVNYKLSSFDVKLKVDLLMDDNSVVSYILSSSESAIWISNPDEASSIGVEFRASRYLVSTEDYVYALVSSVEFLPCITDNRKYLYTGHTFLYATLFHGESTAQKIQKAQVNKI